MNSPSGFKPNSHVGALPPEMTDDQLRSLFPGVQKTVYLNTAAQSLLPLPVVEAISLMARPYF